MPTSEITLLDAFIARYGPWIGLGIMFLFYVVIPFLRDKVWPHFVKKQEEERRAEENERVARQKEIEDERVWLRNLVAEQVQALQAIKENLVQINADNTAIREAEGGILTNQRTIMDKQDLHHNATMQAVADMREEVARRRGVEEGKRLPKTGPIEPKKEEPK